MNGLTDLRVWSRWQYPV